MATVRLYDGDMGSYYGDNAIVRWRQCDNAIEQRQLSPSDELTKLENWLKCNWSLKCQGREFHSLAAPKRKELMP
ncbi:hypothetical protein DPMN_069038 [Dreissena polymorpha]|uniref:Uncharacterized protein n=1 Tax=Dreissena polymorpha TaxID=45954 RepID=A0A9D3Z3I6_DREPO|nr:hypothetical protein DPMN_069038 [Dreissena polymorpha]